MTGIQFAIFLFQHMTPWLTHPGSESEGNVLCPFDVVLANYFTGTPLPSNFHKLHFTSASLLRLINLTLLGRGDVQIRIVFAEDTGDQ